MRGSTASVVTSFVLLCCVCFLFAPLLEEEFLFASEGVGKRCSRGGRQTVLLMELVDWCRDLLESSKSQSIQ
jgi:hypothetical protein